MLRSWLITLFAVSLAAYQKPSPFPDKEKTRSSPPVSTSSAPAEKSSTPAEKSSAPAEKSEGASSAAHAEPRVPVTAEDGLASFCGTEKDGRRTANGEVFDSNALTAAHARFPLGSRVKVTNIGNGKSITVRINDRFRSTRTVILLSHRAAQELDFIASGSTKVKLEPAE
jgi:rare lipoprotein A